MAHNAALDELLVDIRNRSPGMTQCRNVRLREKVKVVTREWSANRVPIQRAPERLLLSDAPTDVEYEAHLVAILEDVITVHQGIGSLDCLTRLLEIEVAVLAAPLHLDEVDVYLAADLNEYESVFVPAAAARPRRSSLCAILRTG